MNKLRLLDANPHEIDTRPQRLSKLESYRIEAQAKNDRYYHGHSEPEFSSLHHSRDLLLPQLIESCLKKPSSLLDVGAGLCPYYPLLKGHEVSLLDISKKAMMISEERWKPHRSYVKALPGCNLEEPFDLVLCLDLIPELPQALHRLALSDLSEFTKKEGWLIISTRLNPNSYDALEHFLSLVNSEYQIKKVFTAYQQLLPEKIQSSILIRAFERLSSILFRNPSSCLVLAQKKSLIQT